MAELLGRWACTPVPPASSAQPCHSLNLFSVASSSTPWLGSVNSQLVCLRSVSIFNHFLSIGNICFTVYLHWS